MINTERHDPERIPFDDDLEDEELEELEEEEPEDSFDDESFDWEGWELDHKIDVARDEEYVNGITY